MAVSLKLKTIFSLAIFLLFCGNAFATTKAKFAYQIILEKDKSLRLCQDVNQFLQSQEAMSLIKKRNTVIEKRLIISAKEAQDELFKILLGNKNFSLIKWENSSYEEFVKAVPAASKKLPKSIHKMEISVFKKHLDMANTGNKRLIFQFLSTEPAFSYGGIFIEEIAGDAIPEKFNYRFNGSYEPIYYKGRLYFFHLENTGLWIAEPTMLESFKTIFPKEVCLYSFKEF